MVDYTNHIALDPLTVAIDFDGTVVDHCYPHVGDDNPGAVQVLKNLTEQEHRIILYTMRDAVNKSPRWPKNPTANQPTQIPTVIDDAIGWYEEHDIPLFAINCNPTCTFSKSHKVYADMYIDDAALGCPLVMRMDKHGYTYGRPMVDWFAVEGRLVHMGILPKRTLPVEFYAIHHLLPISEIKYHFLNKVNFCK
jgi:hypothetical protein